MNDDSTKRPEALTATVYSYDSRTGFQSVRERSGPAPTAEELAGLVLRDKPTFAFQHGGKDGVFRLTWADGTVEAFRDQPVRYLVLEPDAETGELKPVVRCGLPWYLYLCREERSERMKDEG